MGYAYRPKALFHPFLRPYLPPTLRRKGIKNEATYVFYGFCSHFPYFLVYEGCRRNFPISFLPSLNPKQGRVSQEAILTLRLLRIEMSVSSFVDEIFENLYLILSLSTSLEIPLKTQLSYGY
jgi:hypothetical protein